MRKTDAVVLASSTSSDVLAYVGVVIAGISLAFAIGALGSAIRRGLLRQLRIGAIGIEFAEDAGVRATLEKDVRALRAELDALEVSQDAGREPATSRRGMATSSSGVEVASTTTVVDSEWNTGAKEAHRVSAEITQSEDLLHAYHALGLAQSRVMFWFSVVFASLGFALIALTVVVTVNSPSPSIESGNVVSLISGTIVEAVSALFFVQSNRARGLMAGFFDRLRSDQSLERALRLADEVPDELIRSRLKTMLAFGLADASPSDEIVKMVLASEMLRAPVYPLPSERTGDTGSQGGARSGHQ